MLDSNLYVRTGGMCGKSQLRLSVQVSFLLGEGRSEMPRLTALKLRRIRSGLLSVEVAQAARIERGRYCRAENGWLELKADELARIEKVLAAAPEPEPESAKVG